MHEHDKPLVKVQNVSKQFGDYAAINDVTLDIYPRDFLAILGPSGCGKTSLLNIIAGFLSPTSGRVLIKEKDVTYLSPRFHDTNMVFQDYGLFPHMNVFQNVSYGLRIQKYPTSTVSSKVNALLVLVQLHHLADRSIDDLSGGQKQRVALARALIMEPAVLLLDEPLSALDLQLRNNMQYELKRIHRATGGTFVFVTHDQSEALNVANRIAVMKEGKIVQQGSPKDIYNTPRNPFVSQFIGEANVLSGVRENGQVNLEVGVTFRDSGEPGSIKCVIRPEVIHLSWGELGNNRDEGIVILSGRINSVIFLGAFTRYVVGIGDREIVANIPTAIMKNTLDEGEKVNIWWETSEHSILAST